MKLTISSIHRRFLEIKWQFGLKSRLKDNRSRGWYGEWLARSFLKTKSYSVIRRNWRSHLDRRREIDLICLDQECLVFVEVRFRSSRSLNGGYESLSKKKKKTLLTGCKDFLRLNRDRYPSYRFDVIEVDYDDHSSRLFHHENVSLFP